MPHEPTQEMVFLPEDHILSHRLLEFLQSPAQAKTLEMSQLQQSFLELFLSPTPSQQSIQQSLLCLHQCGPTLILTQPHMRETLTQLSQRLQAMLQPRLYSGPQIGRYAVLKTLGMGGHGVVYLVRHMHTQQLYALKTLLDTASASESVDFTEEAVIAAKLNDPHCVKVHALECDPRTGLPLIVSEYVPGLNGREFLNSEFMQRYYQWGPLKAEVALAFFRPMLAAVSHAHEMGIIHQDIKPENFFISEEVLADIHAALETPSELSGDELDFLVDKPGAWIKLSDWGMSVIKERKDLRMSLERTVTIGSLADKKRGGTLMYMPLEQIDGVGVSRKVDIYALGLVFYEFLTGRPAFEARKLAEGLGESALESPQQFLVTIASSRAFASVDINRDPVLVPLKVYPRLLSLLQGMTIKRAEQRWTTLKVKEQVEEMQQTGDFGRSPWAWLGFALGATLLLILGLVTWALWPKSTVPAAEVTWLNKAALKALDLKTDAPLEFKSLTKASPKNLRRLARHYKGSLLSLPRLQELDPDHLSALEDFQGQELRLERFDPSTPAQLEALLKIPCQRLVVRHIKVKGPQVAPMIASARATIEQRQSLTQATAAKRLRQRYLQSKLALTKHLKDATQDPRSSITLSGVSFLTPEMFQQLKNALKKGGHLDISEVQYLNQETLTRVCRLPLKQLTLGASLKEDPEKSLEALRAFRGPRLCLKNQTHLSKALCSQLSALELKELALQNCQLSQSKIESFESFKGLLDISGTELSWDFLCQILKSSEKPRQLAFSLEKVRASGQSELFLERLLSSRLERVRLYGLHSKNVRSVLPAQANFPELASSFKGVLELPDLKLLTLETSSFLSVIGARLLRFREDIQFASKRYEILRYLAAFRGWIEPSRIDKLRQSAEFWRTMTNIDSFQDFEQLLADRDKVLTTSAIRKMTQRRSLHVSTDSLKPADFIRLMSLTKPSQLLQIHARTWQHIDTAALAEFQGRMITIRSNFGATAEDFKNLSRYPGILVLGNFRAASPEALKALPNLTCECLALADSSFPRIIHGHHLRALETFKGRSLAVSIQRLTPGLATMLARVPIRDFLYIDDYATTKMTDPKRLTSNPEILALLAKTAAPRLIIGSPLRLNEAHATALLNFKGKTLEMRDAIILNDKVKEILNSVPGRKVFTR